MLYVIYPCRSCGEVIWYFDDQWLGKEREDDGESWRLPWLAILICLSCTSLDQKSTQGSHIQLCFLFMGNYCSSLSLSSGFSVTQETSIFNLLVFFLGTRRELTPSALLARPGQIFSKHIKMSESKLDTNIVVRDGDNCIICQVSLLPNYFLRRFVKNVYCCWTGQVEWHTYILMLLLYIRMHFHFHLLTTQQQNNGPSRFEATHILMVGAISLLFLWESYMQRPVQMSIMHLSTLQQGHVILSFLGYILLFYCTEELINGISVT